MKLTKCDKCGLVCAVGSPTFPMEIRTPTGKILIELDLCHQCIKRIILETIVKHLEQCPGCQDPDCSGWSVVPFLGSWHI
jgi:hypothetical protein